MAIAIDTFYSHQSEDELREVFSSGEAIEQLQKGKMKIPKTKDGITKLKSDLLRYIFRVRILTEDL